MLVEALNRLIALATQATQPQMLHLNDSRKQWAVVNGELKEFAVPPTPRQHLVETVSDLISLGNRFGGEGHKVTLWYDETQVVLVLDDDKHRIERITLPLSPSRVWQTIQRFDEDADWYTHADFIRLLRFELRSALPPVSLLEVVRRIKFDTGVVTTSVAERSRETLGKEITQSVTTDVGKLPDYVTLNAPVYTTPGVRDVLSIECAVDVDAGRGCLRLRPMPDELDRVQTAVLESLRDELENNLQLVVGVYRGRP